MNREVHVRFCERRGVRFPSATHPIYAAWELAAIRTARTLPSLDIAGPTQAWPAGFLCPTPQPDRCDAARLSGWRPAHPRERPSSARWRASFASAWRWASLSETRRRASFAAAWRRVSVSDAWRRASLTAARLCASRSDTLRRASFSAAWPDSLPDRAAASGPSAGIRDARLSSLKIFGMTHPV